MDPRTTAGRVSAYDMMLMVYWAMKNPMAHVGMNGEGKSRGDQEPVQAWKDHYQDSRLMYRNIDELISIFIHVFIIYYMGY